MSKDNKPPAQESSSRRKRPYTAPRLTEYGSVAKLTQGGGSRLSDGGTTEKRAICL